MAAKKKRRASTDKRMAAEHSSDSYRHSQQARQRPDVGVQEQFTKKKPPKTYRYDSSLNPALSWDENRDRELAEWLLGLIEKAAQKSDKAVFNTVQEWSGGGVRVESTRAAVDVLKRLTKPFLNWAGKAERHQISVPTVPLFVHERHATKAILDGIKHRKAKGTTLDLFGDAQMDIGERLDAYEHQGPWQNRMILGDSLQIMNSMLEFEGLGGQVQMIYLDPPYGVKFGSNFQPFVRKRDVKHGGDGDMTREPEMVKAYRDTWELGLHSYLSYLRDRLLLARELLHESGSIFVQIGGENVHHVRELMDEVFGPGNLFASIVFRKTTGAGSPSGYVEGLPETFDALLWYARDRTKIKFRRVFVPRAFHDDINFRFVEEPNGGRRALGPDEDPRTLPQNLKLFSLNPMTSQSGAVTTQFEVKLDGRSFFPKKGGWKTNATGMDRLRSERRLYGHGNTLRFVRYADDFRYQPVIDIWDDTRQCGFGEDKIYVVQRSSSVIERRIQVT